MYTRVTMADTETLSVQNLVQLSPWYPSLRLSQMAKEKDTNNNKIQTKQTKNHNKLKKAPKPQTKSNPPNTQTNNKTKKNPIHTALQKQPKHCKSNKKKTLEKNKKGQINAFFCSRRKLLGSFCGRYTAWSKAEVLYNTRVLSEVYIFYLDLFCSLFYEI